MVPKTCSIDECEKSVKASGYCSGHYQRLMRHGDPMKGGVRFRGTREESFEFHTEWRGGCLEWTANRNPAGYGVTGFRGTSRLAHRYAWEMVRGKIPRGLMVDHICHNPACCNIAHLRLVSAKQNSENQSGARECGSSGHLGVHSRGYKWRVRVRHYGETHHGGTFATIEEAAIAARALRNELFTHNNLDRNPIQ